VAASLRRPRSYGQTGSASLLSVAGGLAPRSVVQVSPDITPANAQARLSRLFHNKSKPD
jgi:hypothetical protein